MIFSAARTGLGIEYGKYRSRKRKHFGIMDFWSRYRSGVHKAWGVFGLREMYIGCRSSHELIRTGNIQ
jgi:hypothetical protein